MKDNPIVPTADDSINVTVRIPKSLKQKYLDRAIKAGQLPAKWYREALVRYMDEVESHEAG